MTTIKLLLFLMITKQHIVKLLFSLLLMGNQERLLFKLGSMHLSSSVLTFLFYSRVITGGQGTASNHALFYVDDIQMKNEIKFFENLNLNDNKNNGSSKSNRSKRWG